MVFKIIGVPSVASGNPVPACALPTKFLFLSYANILTDIVPNWASNSSNVPTCKPLTLDCSSITLDCNVDKLFCKVCKCSKQIVYPMNLFIDWGYSIKILACAFEYFRVNYLEYIFIDNLY